MIKTGNTANTNMNILEKLFVGSIILWFVLISLSMMVLLSERRDMQDAKEDIGCVWVETGGDTMVRECK